MAHRTRSGSVPSGSEVPPPPPPPATLEGILAAQTELLRHIAQGQQQQPQGGRAHQQPHVACYEYFLGTQPPLFHKTEDRLTPMPRFVLSSPSSPFSPPIAWRRTRFSSPRSSC